MITGEYSPETEPTFETIEPKGIDQLLEERLSDEREGMPVIEPIHFNFEHDETVRRISAKFTTAENEIDQNTIASEVTFYNPASAIQSEGIKHRPVRVESRSSELDSTVMFFHEQNNTCTLDTEAPMIESSQDPAYHGKIQGKNIFSVVHVSEHVSEDPTQPNGTDYCQYFYEFENGVHEINPDKPFAVGPAQHKDTCFAETADRKVAMFIRPHSGPEGRGRVAFTKLESLDDIQAGFENAQEVEGLFQENEWGAVNTATLLEDGTLGVIGHIAREVTDTNGQLIKEYYVTRGRFEPETNKMLNWEIWISAGSVGFPFNPKRPELSGVVYPGGINENDDGSWELTVGIGDSTAGVYRFQESPFAHFLNPPTVG